MSRISTYFYPPDYSSSDLNRQRQIRLGINICLAFVAMLLIFQPLYLFFLDSLGAGILILPGIALFLALLFLLRKGTMRFELFANVLIGVTLVVHTVNTCTTGGPMSIFLAGYIDMQIMSALLLKRTPAYIWIGLQILVPVALAFLEMHGLKLPYAQLDSGSPQMQLVFMTAIVLGAAMFIVLMKISLDSALTLLDSRNKELAQVHERQIQAEKLAAGLEQQRRIDALRERIARDLHDDIGSALSAINIYSNIAEQQGENSQMLLRKITDSSGRLMEAMGDIVWSVNHSNDRLEVLLSRMREYALSLLESQQINVMIDFIEAIPETALPAGLRKDFYLIFKEAVNNISKHGRARSVWVRLSTTGNNLQLLIRDDGTGFDPESVRAEGNGLRNMSARATAIGAKLQIDAAPGKGTGLCLSLDR